MYPRSRRIAEEEKGEYKMFTIKIVKEYGEEQLYETECLALRVAGHNTHGFKYDFIEFTNNSDDVEYIVADGNVYIMNESGKTVANYYLGTEKNVESNEKDINRI